MTRVLDSFYREIDSDEHFCRGCNQYHSSDRIMELLEKIREYYNINDPIHNPIYTLEDGFAGPLIKLTPKGDKVYPAIQAIEALAEV